MVALVAICHQQLGSTSILAMRRPIAGFLGISLLPVVAELLARYFTSVKVRWSLLYEGGYHLYNFVDTCRAVYSFGHSFRCWLVYCRFEFRLFRVG
jgi:hypothetical protein